jgi:hypothetical protein
MLLEQEQIFSKEECVEIIDLEKLNHTKWSSLNDRHYDSYGIFYNVDTKWIFDKLTEFFERKSGAKIITIKDEIHFHKFIKGDWFDRHNDVRERRFFAVGVLLNDDFEGGDFIMYNDEKNIITKTIGNTYIFDVNIEHEVTPMLNGTRYSLLWFLQNEHIKMNKNKFI